MSVIYYTYYDRFSGSVREISRLEHELGRALLFKGLSELYDISCAEGINDSLVSAGPDGKPFLTDHPEIFFNITHAAGLVACAFHSGQIGIDAELRGYFPEVLIGRALAESEEQLLLSYSSDESMRQECFWRLWTLKEAYVKKSGIGVDTDLKAFSFSFEDRMRYDGSGLLCVRCSDPSVSCFQFGTESGHIISLCIDHNIGYRIDQVPDASLFDIIQYVDLGGQVNYNTENTEHQYR